MKDNVQIDEENYKLLAGSYFVPISEGTLCLNFESETPELWFENQYGNFKLHPYVDENPRQIKFDFDNDLLVSCLAAEYRSIFSETIERIADFSTDRHTLATFCVRYGKPALQLLSDSPAVAFLMAKEEFYRFNDEQHISVELVSPLYKRSEILQSYGYPGSASIAKLFRKIPAYDCCSELLTKLKKLLNNRDSEVINYLRHTIRINRLVVELLALEMLVPFMSQSLLDGAADTSQEDKGEQFYRQLVDLQEPLAEALDQGFRIPILRDLAALDLLHDGLIREFHEQNIYKRLEMLEFSSPPFPGLTLEEDAGGYSRIEPIEHGKALWTEGKMMHHCIAGFASSIRYGEGNKYVYHLERADQERATMLIGCHGGRWIIQEIRGPYNVEVSAEMRDFAEKWLDKQVRWLHLRKGGA